MKAERVNIAIFYITNKSHSLAIKLKRLYPDAEVLKFESHLIQKQWNNKSLFIFIMATGIVVRSISPLLKNKKTDPAVLVLDDEGKYVISLLSGHIGGANFFASEVADFIGAKSVITTASDLSGMISIDLWARDNNLIIENEKVLPSITTKFLNNGHMKIYDETNMRLPKEFIKVKDMYDADILITNRLNPDLTSNKKPIQSQLILRPKNLVLGLGCNSGTTQEEISSVVIDTLKINNLSFSSIYCLATIDKKASEEGLIAFAQKHGFEIKTFAANELNKLDAVKKSEAVFKATGAFAVAEPSAILASGHDKLVVTKQKKGNVTIAVSELKPAAISIEEVSEGNSELFTQSTTFAPAAPRLTKKGKIYIVGTGPGNIMHITSHALEAIESSNFIVGYDTYLNLISELIKDKTVISTGMTEEIDRCKKAIEFATDGWTVSLISGGDPGIYAMAGLVLELLTSVKSESDKHDAHIPDVEVIPGISALNAAASRLGAPIMHDFASISLSDRLTPWEIIARRLEAAASADFVIVLYNPKSKGRSQHINVAISIIQKHRSLDTPVGIVKQAMREGEKVIISTLRDFLNHEIDMQTIIIVGNSQTFIRNGWMITPRGYRIGTKKE